MVATYNYLSIDIISLWECPIWDTIFIETENKPTKRSPFKGRNNHSSIEGLEITTPIELIPEKAKGYPLVCMF